jgi:hypothetical protein
MKSSHSAPFDYHCGGSSQGGQYKIHIDNGVHAGRNPDLLLANRLEIHGLSQHPAGRWHGRIAPLDSDGDGDRGIGVNPEGLYVCCNRRPGMQKRCPDQPGHRKHNADADQAHQQWTRHPRLRVAAAEPLASIGHVDNLFWPFSRTSRGELTLQDLPEMLRASGIARPPC